MTFADKHLKYPVYDSLDKATPVIIVKQLEDGNAYAYTCLNEKLQLVKIDPKRVRFNDHAIKTFYKVIVKSCTNSSKLFGRGNIKRNLVGKEITSFSITQNFECLRDNVKRDVVLLETDFGQQRFLPQELDFVLRYEVNDKNFPKDRTIATGKNVIVVKDKGLSIKRGIKGKVIDIVKISRQIKGVKYTPGDLALVELENKKTMRIPIGRLKVI